MGGATVVIEVALTEYQASQDEAVIRDKKFTAKWYEPRFEFESYPEVPELAWFAEAVRHLSQLISEITPSNENR